MGTLLSLRREWTVESLTCVLCGIDEVNALVFSVDFDRNVQASVVTNGLLMGFTGRDGVAGKDR